MWSAVEGVLLLTSAHLHFFVVFRIGVELAMIEEQEQVNRNREKEVFSKVL